MVCLRAEESNRFWSKVVKTKKCWMWVGAKSFFGHGIIRFRGGHIGALRLSFSIRENISKNLCVLHKCDVPQCVNPKHLYQGTKKQNTIDSVIRNRHHESAKTHCSHGHEFTQTNTYRSNGQRCCRSCNKRKCLEYYYANK